MIYFIVDDSTPMRVKIGYTDTDPSSRLRVLQVGNPHKLQVFATIQGTEQIEKWIHVLFRHDRIRGEWFDFTLSIKEYVRCALLSQKIHSEYV